MRNTGIPDGRNNFSQKPSSAAEMVLGDLSHGHIEERSFHALPATTTRHQVISRCVAHGPQDTTRDAREGRPVHAERYRPSRRDIHRGKADTGCAESHRENQKERIQEPAIGVHKKSCGGRRSFEVGQYAHFQPKTISALHLSRCFPKVSRRISGGIRVPLQPTLLAAPGFRPSSLCLYQRETDDTTCPKGLIIACRHLTTA